MPYDLSLFFRINHTVKFFQKIETGTARHLDIQEKEIRIFLVDQFQRPATTAGHAGQRVICDQHRQAGLFLDQAVQVAQQGAAARQDDTALGDVGGQLSGFDEARPFANIPLVWMVEKLEACALPLPEDWRSRFPTDPDAPHVGSWRGWGKYFVARRKRRKSV